MTDPVSIFLPDVRFEGSVEERDRPLPLLRRWRRNWDRSFRFRLLVLGLLPLLVAFPFILGVLALMGNQFTDNLLTFNLRKDLSTSRNYIDQVKLGASVRVNQLAHLERLSELIKARGSQGELNALLRTAAQGSGLDYLLVADARGTVIGASDGQAAGRVVPDSYVTRQASIGLANAAYERFSAEQLAALSPELPAAAGLVPVASARGRALVINAGAHLPLSVDAPDAILLGGILLNRNFALVEHMREVVYPVNSQPDDAQGMTAIYLDGVDVAVSSERSKGFNRVGTAAPHAAWTTVIDQGQSWLGQTLFDGQSFMAGFEPLVNGQDERVGMIGVAFPDQPYKRKTWVLLGMVAGLLALTMLGLTAVIVRTGRTHVRRLGTLAATMTAFGRGQLDARVPEPATPDELARLGWHFNRLLDTIAAQDARQRAAQQALADEVSRRRALFENERDGVVILNTDGSVFEANPKCADMLGYTMDELRQLNIRDWVPHFAPLQIEALLRSVGRDGLFFETVQRCKDGRLYPAELSLSRAEWGEHSFVLALQRDITQRKATERELDEHRRTLEQRVQQRTRELNERSQQLATIFTLSPDGFVSFDRSRRVSFANQSFLTLTGISGDALIGMDEDDFAGELAGRCIRQGQFPGPSMLRDMRQDLALATTTGQRSARWRIELSPPANRVLEVGLQVSESETVSQILYFRDITVETEVDRMKSEFLSTAAHELRTPMTSIFGYTELLRTQDFDADTRRQFLDTIFHQSELMISIINELLDLARIEARRGKDFQLEPVTLQDLVRRTLADYRPPDGRDPPQLIDNDAPLLVDVDRKKLRQVILNIVSNAYKYSPQGGTVFVRFSVDRNGGRIRNGFSIQDQGIGMDAGELSHVFERFYRADTSGKIPGTGLGLSIVKEIIDLHGGEIELHSQPGVGTRVDVWLPAAPAQPMATPTSRLAEAGATHDTPP